MLTNFLWSSRACYHYIRSLQAAAKKATYNEKANTLFADFGFPAANVPTPVVAPMTQKEEPPVGDHSEGGTGHSTTEGH